MKHLLWMTLLLAGQDPEIRLLVRADDMGVALAVNEACMRAVHDGIARSVEVIVPGPWYLDAVRRLNETQVDVGIHLCLTSEWDRVKWRALTGPSSVTLPDGTFHPTTRALNDSKPRAEDIERELRAQIERLKRDVPRISHASSHMGTAVSTPEARAVTEKLCKEFGLRLEAKGAKGVRNWSGKDKSPEEKETALIAAIEKLEPGTHLIVEHPGVDTEEMRAIGHKGYENVAADRAGVTHAFTSAKVKKAIADRGVKLISHLDLKE